MESIFRNLSRLAVTPCLLKDMLIACLQKQTTSVADLSRHLEMTIIPVFLCRQAYRFLSPITPEEKKEIVSAMNLSQGRWYKCPQGHVYTIGGCGQAMQRSTCPECRVVIGGTEHRLTEGNMPAFEMNNTRTRLGHGQQNYDKQCWR